VDSKTRYKWKRRPLWLPWWLSRTLSLFLLIFGLFFRSVNTIRCLIKTTKTSDAGWGDLFFADADTVQHKWLTLADSQLLQGLTLSPRSQRNPKAPRQAQGPTLSLRVHAKAKANRDDDVRTPQGHRRMASGHPTMTSGHPTMTSGHPRWCEANPNEHCLSPRSTSTHLTSSPYPPQVTTWTAPNTRWWSGVMT